MIFCTHIVYIVFSRLPKFQNDIFPHFQIMVSDIDRYTVQRFSKCGHLTKEIVEITEISRKTITDTVVRFHANDITNYPLRSRKTTPATDFGKVKRIHEKIRYDRR